MLTQFADFFFQRTYISANTSITKYTYFLTKQHKEKNMYKKDLLSYIAENPYCCSFLRAELLARDLYIMMLMFF